MSGQLVLNEQGLRERAAWEAAGFSLPRYDREAMVKATRARPVWLHFGAGNIFKAFQANAAQRLLNEGSMTAGIIAVERSDSGGKRLSYEAHDNYTVLVTLKADGSIEKTVVGSIAETRFLFSKDPAEYARLREIFTAPSLQMVSFTITEKGYAMEDGKGQFLPAVTADMKAGPGNAESYMGKLAGLLYERFRSGASPVAMVSMDNCSHNGDKLRTAIAAFASAWAENGLVPKDFAAYIESGAKVSFPWTMIDKITPSPDAQVAAQLQKDGLRDMDASVTASGTHIAPFVNAEESEYLVIEDDFPNGRPPLEKAGILFTDRDTVNKVERMKVCTCLNPLHTALAICGCLLGYQKISEEMKDPELLELVRRIGYQEGLPVVENPGVMDPKAFLDAVLNVRLPNPFMPDTPQRIATDTSQNPLRRDAQGVYRLGYAARGGSDGDSAGIRALAALSDGGGRRGQAVHAQPGPAAGERRRLCLRLPSGGERLRGECGRAAVRDSAQQRDLGRGPCGKRPFRPGVPVLHGTARRRRSRARHTEKGCGGKRRGLKSSQRAHGKTRGGSTLFYVTASAALDTASGFSACALPYSLGFFPHSRLKAFKKLE